MRDVCHRRCVLIPGGQGLTTTRGAGFQFLGGERGMEQVGAASVPEIIKSVSPMAFH